MRITVSEVRTGGIKKKITDLNKFLKQPVRAAEFSKAENKIHNDWIKLVASTFNKRSSKGLRCDQLLQQSLAIEIKGKNSIITYVKPIQRSSKSRNSSGGPVQNLTTILFRGSRSSFGKYHPKWDARVQVGVHPGVSPSPMRNMWNRFKIKMKKELQKALREGLKKVKKK